MNNSAVALGSGPMSQNTQVLGRLGKYLLQTAIVCLAYVVAGELGEATANQEQ